MWCVESINKLNDKAVDLYVRKKPVSLAFDELKMNGVRIAPRNTVKESVRKAPRGKDAVCGSDVRTSS